MTALPKPAKRTRSKTRPRRRRKGSKAALAREADRLWSKLVWHYSLCEGRQAELDSVNCVGSYQAAHGFSRRYRNTRWLPINGFSLCAAHHMYYTHRPIEWDNWLHWV